ncbi:hypothetical protein BofuT4_P102290.1 [Botrytis cinerea T4]|uniref:Uncharacterized protein n=1 Tax=Botryotinia fuckeliana (strain T4) TaxID=999810 RepID=G2YBD7_BOTF4|nr:hypothetical protein BofuT4_P102290.1 [Botrytis cinerea T4]
MAVKFYPSQIGSDLVTPLSYTASPGKLFFQDLWLVFVNLRFVPGIFIPLTSTPSGVLDELYPSPGNLLNLALHAVLFFLQLCFILSVPIWFIMPVWVVATGFTMFWMFNYLLCLILNGSASVSTCESAPEYAQRKEEFAHERWLYMNGVCTGHHWLKGSVDRLALTFGRPVLGIHNRTKGLIFDLFECLIQRTLNYATADIRTSYRILKGTLYEPDVTRVMFILHSQGSIEGSMIIDWLLAEIPQDLLQKLEVYTFGSAANHFNNPHLQIASQNNALAHPSLRATSLTRTVTTLFTNSNTPVELPPSRNGNGKAIPHIEHYAHTYDFVSQFGVLHYHRNDTNDTFAPRFMGRLFEVEASGHMFVQHYLDTMFPLSKSSQRLLNGTGIKNDENTMRANWDRERVDEDCGFMTSSVEGKGRVAPEDKLGREDWEVSCVGESDADSGIAPQISVKGAKTNGSQKKKWTNFPVEGTIVTNGAFGTSGYKVKNLSRLWLYRDGRSPMN